MNKNIKKLNAGGRGFTLIELLVVIGIIAILAAIVIVAINPSRQFAQARNTQRESNVASILNAIGQNIADHKGIFSCGTIDLITGPKDIKKTGGFDLRPCIIPTYMPEVPGDPKVGTNTCTNDACSNSGGDYNTHYTVEQDTQGRVKVCSDEHDEAGILTAGPYCLTR